LDGANYLLELSYSDDRKLILNIPRYGPDVEVLAPKSLRRKVAERLRAAAAQYGAD
jgi:predicted DNA-binding transcriptional regulator YafY